MANEFQFPKSDEHAAIVGRNGTGKSQLGAFVLSKRDLSRTINIVTDYKGEELFAQLRNAREISVDDPLPKKPGLYILPGVPSDAFQEKMEAYLWKIWQRGRIGLFIDEGYMIPNDGAFRAILTQGRSKRIPTITLSQRPVEIDRFVFSESVHVVLLDLDDARDLKTVRAFTPPGFVEWVPPEFGERLPDYHARWYYRKNRSQFVLRPVPKADEIIAAIDGQLPKKTRWI